MCVTIVQISIELGQTVSSVEARWMQTLTRAGDVSLSYELWEYEIPSGVDSKPPRSPPYGPPIDHVPAIGSPVSAMAITESAAANSGPKL
jgi:hypothetical protein